MPVYSGADPADPTRTRRIYGWVCSTCQLRVYDLETRKAASDGLQAHIQKVHRKDTKPHGRT